MVGEAFGINLQYDSWSSLAHTALGAKKQVFTFFISSIAPSAGQGTLGAPANLVSGEMIAYLFSISSFPEKLLRDQCGAGDIYLQHLTRLPDVLMDVNLVGGCHEGWATSEG